MLESISDMPFHGRMDATFSIEVGRRRRQCGDQDVNQEADTSKVCRFQDASVTMMPNCCTMRASSDRVPTLICALIERVVIFAIQFDDDVAFHQQHADDVSAIHNHCDRFLTPALAYHHL